MRHVILPALTITLAASGALSLQAQSTGGIKGKVLDSKGNPVANATVSLSKVGVTWVKELKTGSDGSFMQVGLDPKEYDITVAAAGYVDFKERDKISLGIVSPKTYTLYTSQEAVQAGLAKDPTAAAANVGLESFNKAVALFNERNYTEALPLLEQAVSAMQDSIGKASDEAAKTELQGKLESMSRPYAFSMMEVAKQNAEKRTELLGKAEPILKQAFEKNPKDQNALVYLVELAKGKNDTEGLKKYQGALDTLLGPRPELAFNQGVEAFNAGNMKEAKPKFLKAIEVDPKFADAYYLLAMCNYSENDLKSTKLNLQKYIELAPNGKNAAEAKAMLADPSLKNVK